jgi:hypothetical protein
MQINEFSKPITSSKLNESLAQKFGYKLNLERFTLEQLHDARNKLRTVQHQFETNESYDAVLENTKYQKNKMFLDVINQEIAEREVNGDVEVEKKEKVSKKAKSLKEYNQAMANLKKATTRFCIPETWVKEARSRIALEEDTEEDLVNELIVRYDLDETTASEILEYTLITEGEEEKAELIMASKDMVDRITGWLEDVAAMKSEAVLDLLDSIRDEMGSEVSSQFEQSVRPALDAIYTALETNRQSLSQAVSILTGQEGPGAPMAAAGGEELPPPEAEAGLEAPEEPEGREMRESVQYSRKLATILASKKK